MRASEAAYIGASLRTIPIEQLSPILNLGSQSAEWRRTRPHVDREIFDPLVARSGRVVHADLKDDDGVDIVGDIYDPEFQSRCRRLGLKTVFCCNILEHVLDPREFANIVSGLVPPGGFLVVSVPYSYPFHADPVDTLFRPSPAEIVALFGPSFSTVVAHVLTDMTWLEDLASTIPRHRMPLYFAKDLAKALSEIPSKEKRFRRLHRYLWLGRPYKISIVILRRIGAAN
jgi:hypothetical protein